MQRIVILGGGVGGTLTANLLVRKLKKEIARGEAEVTVVDATGQHTYQPGFMYIAMGGESAATLHRPERSLLDARIELVTGRIAAIDEVPVTRNGSRTMPSVGTEDSLIARSATPAARSWCMAPARRPAASR